VARIEVKRKYKQCRDCQYSAICMAGGPNGVHELFRCCMGCLGVFRITDGVGIEARFPDCEYLRKKLPVFHRATPVYCPYCQADKADKALGDAHAK
jgi:hypothetical protein